MKTKTGYCPTHKKTVKATTRTGCSSLFCSECKKLTKLARKPQEA